MEEVKPREPKLDGELTDQETIRLLEAKIKQLEQEVAAAARGTIEAQACQAARSAFCSHMEAKFEVERDRLKAESGWQALGAQWEAKQDHLSKCLEQHKEQLKQREEVEESLQEQLKHRQQLEESLTVCLVTAIGLNNASKSCGCKRKRAEDLDGSDDYMPPSQDRKGAPARELGT